MSIGIVDALRYSPATVSNHENSIGGILSTPARVGRSVWVKVFVFPLTDPASGAVGIRKSD